MTTENFKNIEKSFINCVGGGDGETRRKSLESSGRLAAVQNCKDFSGDSKPPGQGRSPEHSALCFLLF